MLQGGNQRPWGGGGRTGAPCQDAPLRLGPQPPGSLGASPPSLPRASVLPLPAAAHSHRAPPLIVLSLDGAPCCDQPEHSSALKQDAIRRNMEACNYGWGGPALPLPPHLPTSSSPPLAFPPSFSPLPPPLVPPWSPPRLPFAWLTRRCPQVRSHCNRGAHLFIPPVWGRLPRVHGPSAGDARWGPSRPQRGSFSLPPAERFTCPLLFAGECDAKGGNDASVPDEEDTSVFAEIVASATSPQDIRSFVRQVYEG